MRKLWPKYNKVVFTWICIIILVATLAYLGYLLTITTTNLEKVLIQFIQLMLTIAITYIPTKAIASKQERELMQNRARMAIRRTATLDSQMRQVALSISKHETQLASSIDNRQKISANTAIDGIAAVKDMHQMQFYQISAVMEDWTDVLPTDQANYKPSGGKKR